MAIIKPFKGFLYNKKFVKNIGDVTAPPYDVISTKERNEFYRRHSFNITRLTLGKEYKSDNNKINRYVRSKRLFEKMQKERVILQDKKHSFYYYTQGYSLPDGEKLEKKGFLALLKIADFDEGIVFRHERILSEPFRDRVNLIKECSANFSPIFMLYPDKNNKVMGLFDSFIKGRAHIDFTDKDDIRHRLWKVDDEKLISDIEKLMKRKILIIADGHHRYGASMKFRNSMRKKAGKRAQESPYDYTMVYFTSMEDKGLSILPIHRLVYDIKNFNPEAILKELSRFFIVEQIKFKKGCLDKTLFELKDLIFRGKKDIFPLYFRSTDRFYILKPIKDKIKESLIKSGVSPEMANLNVIVLHRFIFEKILGITKSSQDKQRNIIYVKGNEDLNSVIKRRDYQAAFLLNPISSVDVYKIVKKAEILPQKTTFFYPKLISGFVINKMD
ncbi:DUF1015 domain-containing protein [candidate division KSB1 bacterium]